MEYYLGIDIGTTSVKSIAFSGDGKPQAEHSVSYPISHPFPDRSEQDPFEILRAVQKTVENILQALSPAVPKVCGFSSAMHSLIAVDATGRILTPSIIWADNRATLTASRIREQNLASEFYRRTGLPVHAMSPLCKILWLKEHDAGVFAAADKFIGIKEFIFFHLFGVYAVDASLAAATGLMNMHTRAWDPWILEQAGLSESHLSEIVPTTRVFTSPKLFPSLRDVPFVIGASDGALANIGTSDESDALVITIGTSSAARVIVKEPKLDDAMRTFCYYLTENQYLVGGASNNGGIVMQWLHEKWFRSTTDLDEFSAQAAAVPPGSGGLIFLPYLLGERAPVWNAAAKGVLFGLDVTHGQNEMVRASMEGVLYCLYGISQPLFEKTSIRTIYASGGSARNRLWLQMLADVFDLPVVVLDTIESSAWGAARWGMMSLNIAVSASPSARETFTPDRGVHAVYQAGFEKFSRIYALLEKEM